MNDLKAGDEIWSILILKENIDHYDSSFSFWLESNHLEVDELDEELLVVVHDEHIVDPQTNEFFKTKNEAINALIKQLEEMRDE